MRDLRSPDEAEQLKAKHYDRIEIECADEVLLAIDDLGDAYSPTLRFLQWITRT
jgi:hypothetical protein